MLTVFWCSTSYSVLIVLWKMVMVPVNSLARWWHCESLKCIPGLRRLEKTLNFFRCIHVIDLVLKYGSDINEGNLIQLLFYVIVLMSIVASVIGLSFFSCVSSFRLNFSRTALWPKRLQLDSKSDLTTTGLFLDFFLVSLCLVSSTSYLHELKSTWITQLFFYLTISIFLVI